MARHPNLKIARLVQVLVSLDEPQLMLLETSYKSLIIAVAVADPRYENPYFCAEISRSQFDAYNSEQFDLYYLFTRPNYGKWFIIDLAEMREQMVPLRNASLGDHERQNFMPGRGVFAREHTQPYESLHSGTMARERIYVDGSWDLPDFSHFYGQYTDLYVLYNSIDKFLDENEDLDRRRRIQNAFIRPWEGGGSYGAFYVSLLNVQSDNQKLKVDGINYHSPGYVDIRGRSEPFIRLRDLLGRFETKREEIVYAYNVLHKHLSRERLLTLPASKFPRDTPVAIDLIERGRNFSLILGAIDYDILLRMAGNDQLVAAKVLLSMHRRLYKLYEFFVQGRASFEKPSN